MCWDLRVKKQPQYDQENEGYKKKVLKFSMNKFLPYLRII